MFYALRNVDKYGVPVQLIYNRKASYKTMFGSFITMASMIGLFVYFCLLAQSVHRRENY
jgi:hypothetical protein